MSSVKQCSDGVAEYAVTWLCSCWCFGSSWSAAKFVSSTRIHSSPTVFLPTRYSPNISVFISSKQPQHIGDAVLQRAKSCRNPASLLDISIRHRMNTLQQLSEQEDPANVTTPGANRMPCISANPQGFSYTVSSLWMRIPSDGVGDLTKVQLLCSSLYTARTRSHPLTCGYPKTSVLIAET